MDVVQATSTPPISANPALQEKHASLISNDFNTFLVMLTAQMKNQDPLNPIESSDYATQLATFSGVEQQVKTNSLLESLVAQIGMSGISEMASWVGMDARSNGPLRFDGIPVALFPQPLQEADQLILVGMDAQGREVSRDAIDASSGEVAWAGTDSSGRPVPDGSYSFKLENYKNGALIGTSDVEGYSRVTEIQNGPDGPVLVLEGGNTLSPSEVLALRHPATP